MTLAETQVAEVRAEQASNDYCLRGPLSTVGSRRAGFLPNVTGNLKIGNDLPAAGARSPARNLSGAGFLLPPKGAIQPKAHGFSGWRNPCERALEGRNSMPHSPTDLLVYVVFSTKGRALVRGGRRSPAPCGLPPSGALLGRKVLPMSRSAQLKQWRLLRPLTGPVSGCDQPLCRPSRASPNCSFFPRLKPWAEIVAASEGRFDAAAFH